MAIDYDRGVLIRRHAFSGAKVFMYVDEPGVFRSAHGSEVSVDLAREAGFDVDSLLREKAKRERMTEAQRIIEEEFSKANTRDVVAEREGFKLIHLGNGLYQVLDPEGQVLTPRPVAEDLARVVFDGLAPKKPVSEKKDKK